MEEILQTKKGAELFRHLLQVYPTADLEDYYKLGVWKEDIIKADLQLIVAHRKEAGSPDPPAIEDVKMPDIPQPPAGMLGAIRPGMPGAVGVSAVRPMGVAGVGTRPAMVSATSVAEMRLIAQFVGKWKLDPVTTKAILDRLAPTRRRFVVQNFKITQPGVLSTVQLQQFVAQCESTGAWGSLPNTPVVGSPLNMMGAGVKRPLTPLPPLDPNKRPRMGMGPLMGPGVAMRPLMGPGVATRPMMAARPGFAPAPRMLAARPGAAMLAGTRPGAFSPAPRPMSMQAIRPGSPLPRPGMMGVPMQMQRPGIPMRAPAARPGSPRPNIVAPRLGGTQVARPAAIRPGTPRGTLIKGLLANMPNVS